MALGVPSNWRSATNPKRRSLSNFDRSITCDFRRTFLWRISCRVHLFKWYTRPWCQ